MTNIKQITGYPSIDKPWLNYYDKRDADVTIPDSSMYEFLWDKNKDGVLNKQEIIERDRLHEESGFNKKSEKTIEVDVTNCQSVKEATNLVINVLKEHKIL